MIGTCNPTSLTWGEDWGAGDWVQSPLGNDLFNHASVTCTCLVALSCLTLCNPMDSSPPSSTVHGILQARILIKRQRTSFGELMGWCTYGDMEHIKHMPLKERHTSRESGSSVLFLHNLPVLLAIPELYPLTINGNLTGKIFLWVLWVTLAS